MPCFKGLAVSIHTRDGPLPEYSIQKQSRASRISAYIAVPPPQFTEGSSIPEQANFAVSITLLTPGGTVPYSKPSPTENDPFPNGKIVGGLPGLLRDKNNNGIIGPYIPLTSSPNETVAAYIHFDGRAKEEVATLLRRGEETWVNSRWVSVPESEGGGLAEREFLFREVGLERWLNGLDLEGETKDVAARIERRKQRLEKKRRKRLDIKTESDDEDAPSSSKRTHALGRNGVLRYGENSEAPIESLSGDENMAFSSDSDSDDEMPASEAAGQIKVSLFRVLASGEIKRGEYSPQFDAHDDDEGSQQNGDGADDVDHTTTFAKPKTLDPKSISTQTVTGIDPTDKPFATFTFLYRGRKQLQKMGILRAPEPAEQRPVTAKRKSKLMDFSSLGPLKSKGTVGFAGYRDPTTASLAGKSKGDDEMDSDPDDRELPSVKPSNGGVAKTQQELDEEVTGPLTAEELSRRGELAEGVKKIQLKRQHSFEPPPTNHKASLSSAASDSTLYATADASGLPVPLAEKKSSLPTSSLSSVIDTTTTTSAQEPRTTNPTSQPDKFDTIGSPFKKQRASIPNESLAKINPFAPTAPVGMSTFSSESEVAPDVKLEDNVISGGFGSGSGANTPKHSNGHINHDGRIDEL